MGQPLSWVRWAGQRSARLERFSPTTGLHDVSCGSEVSACYRHVGLRQTLAGNVAVVCVQRTLCPAHAFVSARLKTARHSTDGLHVLMKSKVVALTKVKWSSVALRHVSRHWESRSWRTLSRTLRDVPTGLNRWGAAAAANVTDTAITMQPRASTRPRQVCGLPIVQGSGADVKTADVKTVVVHTGNTPCNIYGAHCVHWRSFHQRHHGIHIHAVHQHPSHMRTHASPRVCALCWASKQAPRGAMRSTLLMVAAQAAAGFWHRRTAAVGQEGDHAVRGPGSVAYGGCIAMLLTLSSSSKHASSHPWSPGHLCTQHQCSAAPAAPGLRINFMPSSCVGLVMIFDVGCCCRHCC